MGKDAGVRWGINTVKGWFKGGKGGKGVKPPKAEGKPPRRVSEANKGGKGKPSKSSKFGRKALVGGTLGALALKAVSDLLNNNGNGNGTDPNALSRKNNTRTSSAATTKPVSQNIVIKKHDYPNTYRVQLNQLSNTINYAIKRDKISNRKTNNRYQSILCKKIMDKLTLHTEIQNDLIVNEIYNVLALNNDLSDTTKKTFINNLVDLIKPKNKGKMSDTFLNSASLKELKSINKTQTKIYMALKELSEDNLHSIYDKKREHVQKLPYKNTDYQNVSNIESGGNGGFNFGLGGMMGGILAALAGGALFSLFNNMNENGSEGSDTSNGNNYFKRPDNVKGFIDEALWNAADIARLNTAMRSNKATKNVATHFRDAKTNFKDFRTDAQKAANTRRVADNIRLSNQEQLQKNMAKLKPELDPVAKKQLLDKIKKNKKAIALAEEIWGRNGLKKVYPKLIKALKSTGRALGSGALGIFFAGISLCMLNYELDHLDEETEKYALTAITTLEMIPVVGVIVGFFEAIPMLLNLAGTIIKDLIVPALQYFERKYDRNNSLWKEVGSWTIEGLPIGQSILIILDFCKISAWAVIPILKELGEALYSIDPNALFNIFNSIFRAREKAIEYTYQTAEALHVSKNSVMKTLENEGYIKTSGIGGIGDTKVVDFDRIRNELSVAEIDALIQSNALLFSDKQQLENIKNSKMREQADLIKKTGDPEKDAWNAVELVEKARFDAGRNKALANIGNLDEELNSKDSYKAALGWLNGKSENKNRLESEDAKIAATKYFFHHPWKDFITSIRNQKNDTKYWLVPPITVEVTKMFNKEVLTVFGGANVYFIFLHGTVAVRKNLDKDALYNNNLLVLGYLKSDGSAVLSDTPLTEDKYSFDFYNDPAYKNFKGMAQYRKEVLLPEVTKPVETYKIPTVLDEKQFNMSAAGIPTETKPADTAPKVDTPKPVDTAPKVDTPKPVDTTPKKDELKVSTPVPKVLHYTKPDGTTGTTNTTLDDAYKKVAAAASYARQHAEVRSKRRCAHYVTNALQANGFKFNRPRYAYQYHTNGTLTKLGFNMVYSGLGKYDAKVGDICVVNKFNTPDGNEHYHVAINDGKNWISDFVQKSSEAWNIYKGVRPNNGVYYYRYGASDTQAPTVAANTDVAETFDTTKTPEKQVPFEPKVNKEKVEVAKNNTKDADTRSEKTSKDLAVNERKLNEQKTASNNNDTLLFDVKNNSFFKHKNLDNANVFFTFPVLDYSTLDWG